MSFEDLDNPELQERLRACKTTDELLAVAKEEGMELSDKDLDGISGGWCSEHDWGCPADKCGVYGVGR
jgi:hypothetical protein